MRPAAVLPCLLLCISYLTAGASAKPHYVVLFPAMIYYPYVCKVHVHLVDLDEPVTVSLHLESSQEAPNVTVEQQGSGILQLNWPRFTNFSALPKGMYEIAKMHISIQGGSLQVHESRSVLVDAMELGTFVQTDKDIYKPGETVKFRIVRLDHNFIPSNRELPLVTVQDPSGNPVAHWREVSPRQGIVDLSLSLAAKPVLGTYSIKVEEKTHHFSVVDSGLPHFDILIRLPRVVTKKDEKIPLAVCGRYPSGKRFRGRVEVRLCQSREDTQLPEESARVCAECRGQTGRDSCFSTEVPANYFNLTSSRFERRLRAYASLQEEGTGMWHTAAKSCKIVPGKPTITFEHPDRFYKPGIPYTGTVLVKATNGSALKEKEIFLLVKFGGKTQRKTLLTDGSGRASFELDTSGWEYKITLRGEVGVPEDEDDDYFYKYSSRVFVYPFISGGKSFLKIHSVEKELPCGQPQQLWVDYFFDGKVPGIKLQSLEVVLLVLARGIIAKVLRKELPAEAGLRGSFSLELPIEHELAPSAKVLAYVVLPDGEVVADSTVLKVDKCFHNKVNLSFSEHRALVGSQLRLKVQAAPGSLCAIHASDQRARSPGPKGTINPGTVYEVLPEFSEESYPIEIDEREVVTCPTHWHEGASGAPAPTCYDLANNKSWKICLYKLGYSDFTEPAFYSLVKDAGLKVVSNVQLGCTQIFGLRGYKSTIYLRPEAELEGHELDFLGPWLWQLVPVGEGGSAEMTVTVPNAVTEWEAGMFCTSPLGFGLAPATTLTAFKPFLVELELPYAVGPHEAFTLAATIFNSLQQCLRVQVMLLKSAELEVSASTDTEHSGCIYAGEERTFRWDVRATSLGALNVTVVAKAISSEKLCGTEMPVVPAQGHVDSETKLLWVQPPKTQ